MQFKCYGNEASLSTCLTYILNNTTYCNKNVVKIECSNLIISNCYDFNSLISSNSNYAVEYNDTNRHSCYQLVNILGYASSLYSILNYADASYYIKSYEFTDVFTVYGTHFTMVSIGQPSSLSKYPPCYILYYNTAGVPVAITAPLNRESINTYSAIYLLTEHNGTWSLSGNITLLDTPILVSTMSVVCKDKNYTIQSGYFIILDSSVPLQTNTSSTTMHMNNIQTALFSALENEYYRTQEHTTTTAQPTTTQNEFTTTKAYVIANSTYYTNTTKTIMTTTNNLQFIYRFFITMLSLFLICLAALVCCSIIGCVVYIRKRKKKFAKQSHNNILPSKECLSINNSYYSENMSITYEEFTHINKHYHLFKIDAKASRGFLESTRSLRHTLNRVHIEPKFAINSPEIHFPIVNANKCKDLNHMNQWYIEREELVYLRELGLGYFGKVQLMMLKKYVNIENLPVAVKTLSTQDPVQTEQFMQEMLLMIKVQHQYIVSIIGMCPPTTDATPLMILEYLEYGDLKGLVREYSDKDKTDLNILHLFSMAENIADAVSYISTIGYIHRDIAARNCLVGRKLICKLSDFGLTWSVNEQTERFQYRPNNHIPIKWTAPEAIVSGIFSYKSDVWSYGVLLWEMFSYGMNPLEDLNKEDLLSAAVNGSLSLPHIPNIPELCNTIVQMCCCANIENRPTIQQVHSIIRTVLEKISEMEMNMPVESSLH